MKRILSIDGGGIRGILPAMVLVALEQRLKIISNNPKAHISDYFDFFAGTSTGGLLISLLLYPSEENPNVPKYTAKDALDLYLQFGESIFKTSKWRRFLSKFGLLSELYDEKVLEQILQDYLGDKKLSELLKPCIITAYNIELRKNHLFRQQKAITHGDSRDFYLRDVCRATSAAPTFFTVPEIYSLAGTRYALVDGGLFAHNPSIAALIEVLKNFNTFNISDINILSLGTGIIKNAYNYEDFKKKWAISIGPYLVDIISSSSSESNEYFINQLFQSVKKSQNYIRIDPYNLSSIDSNMDAASTLNIKKLVALGDKMISDNEKIIDQLARDLIADQQKSENKKKSMWNFLKK